MIKRQGDKAEIIISKKLISTTSQILIGLRKTDDNNGLELIQNAPQGKSKTIWSYQF